MEVLLSRLHVWIRQHDGRKVIAGDDVQGSQAPGFYDILLFTTFVASALLPQLHVIRIFGYSIYIRFGLPNLSTLADLAFLYGSCSHRLGWGHRD